MRSLSAASWPAIKRTMSSRSRASRSLVSVRMVGGIRHGLFNLFVETKRDAFHFGEVAFALLGGHRLAHLGKMPEHLGLAFSAQRGQFRQFLVGCGGDVGG